MASDDVAMTPDAFEARTLSLSRHDDTRRGAWWRGFCAGLLASITTAALVFAGLILSLIF